MEPITLTNEHKMSNAVENLPSLSASLGKDVWRAKGVNDWATVEALGRSNCRSLRAFVEETANRALVEDDRETLSETRLVLERLSSIDTRIGQDKPLLPRLRRESFREGERVRIFLGELPEAPPGWQPAAIISIKKAFNPRWKGPEPNSGYYWRITAKLTRTIGSLPSELSFSTSEPRALPEGDLDWLRGARCKDAVFFGAFAENSRRKWQPLWCDELGFSIEATRMDPIGWFAQ